MKHMIIFLILCMTVSCTGVGIRDQVLLPLASQIYENIHPQIVIGLGDAMEEGELSSEEAMYLLGEANKLRDVLAGGIRSEVISIDWKSLEPWAVRGIQFLIEDETISPGVATSLFQRVVNFRDLMTQLGVRIIVSNTRSIYSTSILTGGRPTYIGEAYPIDLNWTPMTKHNKPRRALGIPEIEYADINS